MYWGAPLAAGLQWVHLSWPDPTQQLALGVLFVGATYLAFAQYRLAKPWLTGHPRKSSGDARPDAF